MKQAINLLTHREEIEAQMVIIANKYDITKISMKLATHNKAVVVCVIPFGHYYSFVLGRDKITLVKKPNKNPTIEFLELIASTVDEILHGR